MKLASGRYSFRLTASRLKKMMLVIMIVNRKEDTAKNETAAQSESIDCSL